MVKKVSIIIPIFNSVSNLRNLIQDLEKQTYQNVEVIFVDDQSTDDTLRVLEGLTKDSPQFLVRSIEHAGQSAARNYGIDLSKGDYVIFIDSDDRIHSNYVERLVSVLELEDADIVECRYILGHKSKDYLKLKTSSAAGKILENNVLDLLYSTLISNVNSAPVWNKIYRKKLLVDERFLKGNSQSEDLWFNIKTFSKANRIVRISDELYFYFQNPDSTLHKRVAHKDMEILRTHDLIVSFIKEIYGNSRELELSKVKLARTFYSLILRCLRNKTQLDFSKQDFQILKHGVIINFRVLLSSPMKWNRKVILVILVFMLKLNIINFKSLG